MTTEDCNGIVFLSINHSIWNMGIAAFDALSCADREYFPHNRI